MFHHTGSVHKQDIKLWVEGIPILVWNSSVSCQSEHFTALSKTKFMVWSLEKAQFVVLWT